MRLPSLRAVTIDVLGHAEQLGQSVVIAVRDVDPVLLDGLVESVSRLPSLVGQLATVLSRAETLIASADGVAARAGSEVQRVEQTRAEAGFEVDAVDVTRRRADLVVGDAAAAVQRIDVLVAGAEALLDRVGRLVEDVEGPVRRLLPSATAAANVLADLRDPSLPELTGDLARRMPALLTEMTDDVVPSLAVMRDAAPDVQQLRELVERLEPLFDDVSSTVAGLPWARRARRRGSQLYPSAAGDGTAAVDRRAGDHDGMTQPGGGDGASPEGS